MQQDKKREIILNILIIIAMLGIVFITVFFATGASIKNNMINYCKDQKYREEAQPNTVTQQTKEACESIGITI